MRQLLTVAAAITLLALVAASQASADATLNFSGDALINQYAPGTSSADPNSRILFENYGVKAAGAYADTYDATYPDYQSWAGSVTGEANGIASFQLWFQGGLGTDWGENFVLAKNSVPTFTAPAGWTGEVVDYGQMYWGNPGYYSVWFETTDPADYIRTGSNIGDFSVTGDFCYNPTGEYIPPLSDLGGPVMPGDSVQMWFGMANDVSTVQPPEIWFGSGWSQGWGAQYDTSGNGSGGTGMEGNLPLTATPEPSSILLCVLAGLGLLGYRTWRKR